MLRQRPRSRWTCRVRGIACAGLLALAPACAGLFAPGVPEVTTREFSLQGGFITGTIRIPGRPAGPRPAVLLPVLDPEELLARGIAVVRYQVNWRLLEGLAPERPAADGAEPPGAGDPPRPSPAPAGSKPRASPPPESVGRWLLAAPRPGIVGRAYFRLVAAEGQKIVPLVIDRLLQEERIDPDRLAIAGSSTRGFVALEALVAEPRLAVGVVRVACGDYHEFLRSSSLALDGEERWLVDGELVLDEDYERELRTQEPIRFAERLPPRPLLMLNGALDEAVPLSCVRPTVREFERAYRAAGVPQRFRFVLYQDRGHDLGPAVAEEILAWWIRWLRPQE